MVPARPGGCRSRRSLPSPCTKCSWGARACEVTPASSPSLPSKPAHHGGRLMGAPAAATATSARCPPVGSAWAGKGARGWVIPSIPSAPLLDGVHACAQHSLAESRLRRNQTMRKVSINIYFLQSIILPLPAFRLLLHQAIKSPPRAPRAVCNGTANASPPLPSASGEALIPASAETIPLFQVICT